MIEYKTDFTPDTAGAFLNVPMDVYQSAPGWSGSDLLLLSQWPAKAKARKDGTHATPPSDAMLYGTLLHSMILEGRSEYHLRPDTFAGKKWASNSTECREWTAAHQDRIILTTSELEQINQERDAVANSANADELITGARIEVSLFAYLEDSEGHGVLCKGRLDCLNVREGTLLVADLKTCRDASTRALSKTILNMRYHAKTALYRALLAKLAPEMDAEFYFIALEKGNPPRVNVRHLEPAAIDTGLYAIDDALKLRRRCVLGNSWPDFADIPDDGRIGMIDLPAYAQAGSSVDDLDGMTEAKE